MMTGDHINTMVADICRIPTRTDALMMIYRDKCVFNAAACSLLGVCSGTRVRFVRNLEARCESESRRIYAGVSRDTSGYHVTMRSASGSACINSRRLSRFLSEKLEGYGTYSVCRDSYIEDNGTKFHEIFFRKFTRTN
jgi:hypothetical protein